MRRSNRHVRVWLASGFFAISAAQSGIALAAPASSEFQAVEGRWLKEVQSKLKVASNVALPNEQDWALATRLSDRLAWVFWPEKQASDLISYRAHSALPETASQCVAAGLIATARQAAAFSEHQVQNRNLELVLSCEGKTILTQAQPQAKGWNIQSKVDGQSAFEGELAYNPTASRPSGLAYERQMLHSVAFEENPRASLDYGEALQSKWAKAAPSPTVTCWPALWGTSHRQCVTQTSELGSRQCAVLALKSAYQDIQQKTDAGLPPHHSLDLMMWCGQNRARVKVGREHRIDVEWWRANQANSEMSVAISRRMPIALEKGAGEYERYVNQVNARDGVHADKLKESYERAVRIASWVGGPSTRGADALKRAVEGLDVKCQASAFGKTCQAKASVGATECRELAFATSYVAPLSKGALANTRDFKLELGCSDGHKIEVVRDFDHLWGSHLNGGETLWSDRLELLRAVH